MFSIARNGQKGLSLTEFPNSEIVSDIWRHPDIWQHQRKMVKKYCDEAVKFGKVPVKYVMHKKYGRYFLKDSQKMSSCAMWSGLRNPLFSETEDDIDIVNCHYCIMYNLLKDMDMYSTRHLKNYIDNREKIIADFYISEEAMENYNKEKKSFYKKKDFVKTLFTILLYGGIIDTWEKEFRFDEDDYECPKFLDEYIEELKGNTNILMVDGRFKDIVDWVKKDKLAYAKKKYPPFPDKEKDIKKGVVYFDIDKFKLNNPEILSVILQDYERLLVEHAMRKMIKLGFTITSYNYDGFQILKSDKELPLDLVSDDLISHNNDKTLISFSNIKFIKKEFKEGADLSKIVPYIDEFDYKLYTMSSAYNYSKEYFEKYHFKCLSPPCFVKVFPDGQLQHISSKEKLSTMYSHLKSWYKHPSMGEGLWSFLGKWLDDANMRVYTHMSFYPKPLATPYNHYNMWCDFPISKEELIEDVDISRIYKHFDLIANHDPKVKEYLLNWFAHLVQYPSRKTEVCLLLQGLQGSGKSFFAEIMMEKILGEARIFITSKTDKVFGKFSDLQGKLLVVLNEASGKDTHEIADTIKDNITAHKIQNEKKGIDIVEVIDYCNYIFTTNGFNAVKIPEDDRRFMAIACCNKMKNNKVYFDALYKILHNKKCMRKFYDDLMKRDISNFHPTNDRPFTELGETLKAVNRQYMDLFIDHLKLKDYHIDEEWTVPQVMYNLFKDWWRDENRKADQIPTRTKFLAQLGYHSSIKKHRYSTGVVYKIKT